MLHQQPGVPGSPMMHFPIQAFNRKPRIEAHEPVCDCCRELEWQRECNKFYCRKYRCKNSKSMDLVSAPARNFTFTTPVIHDKKCECCVIIAKKRKKKY